MPHLFLIVCAAIMFALWRKSFAAGWFCFFALELIRRLTTDIARMFLGLYL